MLALHGYKLRGRPMIISFSKSKLKSVGPAIKPSSDGSSSNSTEAVSTSADCQDQTASDNNSTTVPSQ